MEEIKQMMKTKSRDGSSTEGRGLLEAVTFELRSEWTRRNQPRERIFQAERPASSELGPCLGLRDNQGKRHYFAGLVDRWFCTLLQASLQLPGLCVSSGGAEGSSSERLPSHCLTYTAAPFSSEAYTAVLLKLLPKEQIPWPKILVLKSPSPLCNCPALWKFIMQPLWSLQKGWLYSVKSERTSSSHLAPLLPEHPIPFPAMVDWSLWCPPSLSQVGRDTHLCVLLADYTGFPFLSCPNKTLCPTQLCGESRRVAPVFSNL